MIPPSLVSHSNATTASQRLQVNLNEITKWLKTWRIKVNETKSTHVTFTMRRETCPTITLNNSAIPQAEDVKYLGIHLDQRLTWKKHIWMKRKQLGLKLSKLFWLIGRNSQLTLGNKLLIYKIILKPVWSYGIQLWGSSSESNIEILQRFQSKVLRIVTNAPWYVTNEVIHQDLGMCTVREEIHNFSEKYHAKLNIHPNIFAKKLLSKREQTKRLKRFKPIDLTTRFKC